MITITSSVGIDAVNEPRDVATVGRRLAEIGLYLGASPDEFTPELGRAIKDFQDRFMIAPDGKIDPHGQSIRFLDRWKEKTIGESATLDAPLRAAWDWINPLMPNGSYCSSGIRTTEKQRQLLVGFYTGSKKAKIVELYTQKEYDRVLDLDEGNAKDVAMRNMVQAAGQAIAVPGTSKHEKGKAFDIAGAEPGEKKRVARLVVDANPEMFSGKIIKEDNGCVHVEIN